MADVLSAVTVSPTPKSRSLLCRCRRRVMMFDIDLAVVLAGFAFETYTNPPENKGYREVDATNCKTVFLSESFMREIYDGKVFIKLKKGYDFPAIDPWAGKSVHK